MHCCPRYVGGSLYDCTIQGLFNSFVSWSANSIVISFFTNHVQSSGCSKWFSNSNDFLLNFSFPKHKLATFLALLTSLIFHRRMCVLLQSLVCYGNQQVLYRSAAVVSFRFVLFCSSPIRWTTCCWKGIGWWDASSWRCSIGWVTSLKMKVVQPQHEGLWPHYIKYPKFFFIQNLTISSNIFIYSKFLGEKNQV